MNLLLDLKFVESFDKQRVVTAFKNYMKESSLLDISDTYICNKLWREITCSKKVLQNNTFNCGIYVMCYLDCIIYDKPFDTMFKPANYTITVAKALLTSSKCMKDICQYCFSNRKMFLIMCNTCRCWVHQLCLTRKFNNKTII